VRSSSTTTGVFTIGTGTERTVERTGVRTCFANDVAWAYANNSGSVELTVTQIHRTTEDDAGGVGGLV
jgi:hypothetical protein